jgi:Na+-transporting methylmalonyl-CoA/oxaloacetate decarboxylase beta subunit
MLLSASLIGAAAVLIAANFFLHTLALFYIAVGCVIVSIQTFASGLIATLLKQILQQQQQPLRTPAPPQEAKTVERQSRPEAT